MTALPETVLRLSNITKRFGTLLANHAISLDLKRGEIVALLGENGAGKTTLMSILFGHYVADEGSIEVFGKPLPPGEPRAAISAGVGMVHQHFTLADNLTVLDNIMLGTESLWALKSNRAAAKARIVDLSRSFGLAVNPDAPVARLSVGERQRVEILKALYRDARILILDEPTAVLAPQESEALFKTLKHLVADGLSVIFISHKLHEVIAVSDRIVVLRGGKRVAERETKGATRHELAELMVGRQIPQPKHEAQARGPAIVALREVSAANGALFGVTLDLYGGEIAGIAGVSGNGQALLADILSGLMWPESGTFELNGNSATGWTARDLTAHGVARIPEDRHAAGLIGDMTVAENVISEAYDRAPFSRHGLLDWKAATRFASEIIAAYDVKCPSPLASVRLLSGGNMQKLILGRVLSGEPRFILANQPVRGLDVGAIAYVHAQLIAARKRGAAVLLISEDLDEILSLSDRVFVMSQGRLSPPMARAEVSIQQLGLLMAGGRAHAA